MSKLIAINRKDGGVAIMRLTEDALISEEIAKWSELHVGEYVSHREISEDEVPTDRTFRNAWKDAGSGVGIDMPKARELQAATIRTMRAPLFKELDIAYLKALESGDSAQMKAIADKKQALRDAPADPAIAAATTPEELKKVALPS